LSSVPAGVPEPAARTAAGTADPARGDQRRQRQGDLVADAAGRVLVGGRAGRAPKSIRSPERIIASVQRAISRRFMPLSRTAMARADICSSATAPRV
jgi:hypothetical protein